MTNEELMAAAERLRRLKNGEPEHVIYGDGTKTNDPEVLWAIANQIDNDEHVCAQAYLSTARTDDGEELTCMNIDRLCDAIEDDYQRKIAFLAWENSCVFNERHLRELIAMIRRNQVEALGGR